MDESSPGLVLGRSLIGGPGPFLASNAGGGGGTPTTPTQAANFVAASSQSFTKANFAAVQPGTGDFSLECWAKFASVAAGIRTLIGTGGLGAGVGYAAYGNAARISGGIQDAGGSTDFIGAVASLAADTLYHVVCTFDRDGNGTCYLNGSVSGTPSSIATRSGSLDAAVTFALGKLGGSSSFHNGIISCARVYKATLLSGAQITALYNGGTPKKYAGIGATLQAACAGAAWDLDGDATDSSGGGNDLTNNNGVTFVAFP